MADINPEITEGLKRPDGVDWFFEQFMVRAGALEDLKGENGARTFFEVLRIAKDHDAPDLSAIKRRLIPFLSPEQKTIAVKQDLAGYFESDQFQKDMSAPAPYVQKPGEPFNAFRYFASSSTELPPKPEPEKPWWKIW
jgi:hypothetical protein